MNLYLSSYRLGNHPEIFSEMAGDNKRVAVITNALDSVNGESRQRGVQREFDDMSSIGLEPELVDLREYFEKPQELADKMKDFSTVWVRGGNVFLLRQAMERSGFDMLLQKRLLSDPDFVYGGYSAGGVVLGPTLEGIELVDDMHARAAEYDHRIIWRGLGILEYSIAPHFESDHPESAAIAKVVEYFKENDMPFKTLRDGEAIVIHGDEETVVG